MNGRTALSKQEANALREWLGELMEMRVLAKPLEKPAFDKMIAEALQELGYPVATVPQEGSTS